METNDHLISKIKKSPRIPTLVADQIIDHIVNGSLKPGDKLPSEQKMTRLFGISRISLREAMKLLEAKGYIVSHEHKGKYITLPEESARSPIEGVIAVDPRKIWDLLDVRRFLDSEAAACASRRATRNDLAALKRICDRTVELGINTVIYNLKEGGKLYTDFFDLIAECTRNSIFIDLRKSIHTIIAGVLPYSRKKLALIGGSSRAIVQDLFAIYQAIENRDPHAAREATINHINYIKKSLKTAIEKSTM
ncbi:MAG: FadR family transcriptional regulator [Deltaproteobacteria bacterium]|nr:FadR family transcriptional regulator [Deltaproteobacteria bacterium]